MNRKDKEGLADMRAILNCPESTLENRIKVCSVMQSAQAWESKIKAKQIVSITVRGIFGSARY